jgi:hypothetical protein
MSKHFHELDQVKRHLRMADIKLSMENLKECKAEITAASKILTALEKGKNGKHEQASEPSREG